MIFKWLKQSPVWLTAAVLLFSATVAALVYHALHFDFLNDDAFISFRYAYNLAHHGELVFNLGDPVEGYTNFLWTVLMALVIKQGGEPEFWSNALGILCSCLTLAALFVFSLKARFRNSAGHPPKAELLTAAVAPLLLAGTSTFACWTEGGLETALFTLLLTTALLLYLNEEMDGRAIPFSAVVLGLAALTRPEGVLVFGLLAALSVVRDWATRRRILPIPRRWLFAGIFVGIYLPYWLWRYSYYGYPFPNTYYLKGSEPSWGPGFRYLWSFVEQAPAWIALLALVVPSRFTRYKRQLLLLTGVVVLPYTLHVVRVGGDFMSLHRFFMPLLPILYLAFQEALNELMAILFRIQKRVWKWPVRVGTLLATTALIAALGVNTAEINRQVLMVWNERGIDSIGWLKKFVAKGKAIGTYLQKSYPEGTSIATTAAGAIPYYSRFTTQDFLGLNDEYIAHNLKPTLKRPGHRFIASRKFIKYWDSDIIIYHPICTRKKPKPRPGLTKKMDKLGYQWASVRVPGLKPQVWSFYIKKSYAAELPPHLLKSADHLVKRPRAKPKKAKRQKRRALKPRVSRP